MRAIRYEALDTYPEYLSFVESQSAMRAIRYEANNCPVRSPSDFVAIRYACNKI